MKRSRCSSGPRRTSDNGTNERAQTVAQVVGDALANDRCVTAEPTEDVARALVGKFDLLTKHVAIRILTHAGDNALAREAHQVSPCSVASRAENEEGSEDSSGDRERQAEETLLLE